MALGQTEIPAIVTGFDRKEAMLASLVENIARRRVRAIDHIQTIQWMHDQGNDVGAIAHKTGLVEGYVKSILRLLQHGETRLLDAALHGRIPVTIATRIAETKDDDGQQVLMAAYEAGEIKQKSCPGKPGYYVVLDGHLRLKALTELKIAEAACLVATVDDPFTYNDKVSRLSCVQEHRMIMKAVGQGTAPEQIARILGVNVQRIRDSMNMLNGVHADAVEKLKD